MDPGMPGADPSKNRDDQTIEMPTEDDGSSFWTIFLIMFLLGVFGLLVKLFGKQCYEKYESVRGGSKTF